MSILTFPALIPQSSQWWLQTHNDMYRSPLSGTVQTVSRVSERWMATLQYVLVGADVRTMSAFLASLRGQQGRFYLYNHAHSTPDGTGAGTPQVDGAGQTGLTLDTKGWGLSQTVLKAGDFFGFDTELHEVAADAVTDGAGNVSIALCRPIRSSPSDSTSIVTSAPTCVMKLVDDAVPMNHTPGDFASVTINCEEALV